MRTLKNLRFCGRYEKKMDFERALSAFFLVQHSLDIAKLRTLHERTVGSSRNLTAGKSFVFAHSTDPEAQFHITLIKDSERFESLIK